MFPLVELLFHECEQQTSCTSRDTGRMRFRLDEEVANFGRRLELEQIPLFINDTELDTLMIKAVQGNLNQVVIYNPVGASKKCASAPSAIDLMLFEFTSTLC